MLLSRLIKIAPVVFPRPNLFTEPRDLDKSFKTNSEQPLPRLKKETKSQNSSNIFMG